MGFLLNILPYSFKMFCQDGRMLIELIERVHTPKAQEKILKDFPIQISINDLDRQSVIRYTIQARRLVISLKEP